MGKYCGIFQFCFSLASWEVIVLETRFIYMQFFKSVIIVLQNKARSQGWQGRHDRVLHRTCGKDDERKKRESMCHISCLISCSEIVHQNMRFLYVGSKSHGGVLCSRPFEITD